MWFDRGYLSRTPFLAAALRHQIFEGPFGPIQRPKP